MLFDRHVPLLSLLTSLLLANPTAQHFERATTDQMEERVDQISELFDPHTPREGRVEEEVTKSPILDWNKESAQDAEGKAVLRDLEEFIKLAEPFLTEFEDV